MYSIFVSLIRNKWPSSQKHLIWMISSTRHSLVTSRIIPLQKKLLGPSQEHYSSLYGAAISQLKINQLKKATNLINFGSRPLAFSLDSESRGRKRRNLKTHNSCNLKTLFWILISLQILWRIVGLKVKAHPNCNIKKVTVLKYQ
jgi:hypothetical protein